MRKIRVELIDIWWHVGRRAETYEPHPPLLMSSACSVPPIRTWVCDACGAWQYTTTANPPTCSGGFAYSFATRMPAGESPL